MTEHVTMRSCFVARPGYAFCSVDYDTFELRSWSQVCLWAVRCSRLADVLNSDKDPHTELGSRLRGISKEEAYALTGDDLKLFKKRERQTAKIANFGLPGGMGWQRFKAQARKQYDVSLSDDEAQGVCNAWRDEWPEARLYFEWISSLVGKGKEARGAITHFRSNRVRGDVTYTSACNSPFQGLAADAAKAAGWQLAKEMYSVPSSPLYGSRIVIFLHDEYIAELRNDSPERLHAAAMRQAQIMRDVAQSWMPDVKITCSPALMTRWIKGAEARYNDNGLLIPYDSP